MITRKELPLTRSTVVGLLALGAVFTLAAAPAYADATGDVRVAMQRFLSLSSYEMSSTSGSHSVTVDLVKPSSRDER